MARIRKLRVKVNAVAKVVAPVDKLVNVARENLVSYGTETIENRAIPDYRDGCKPSQRAVLWAMYKLALHHTKPFKKSARTVGETIGKYHPHGDAALYSVMVNLSGTKDDANKVWKSKHLPIPLIQGQGNWGDNIEPAAAHRYTEARLTKFADEILLDPRYIAVVPKIPNYAGDEQLPMYLPAKLPLLVLEGYTAIGVAVKAESPAYEIAGVLAAVRQLLQTGEITYKELTKMLKVTTDYGGVCVSTLAERATFIRTGYGRLIYEPVFEVVSDKEIHITSVCPGLYSQKTIQKAMDKIASLKSVQAITDESAKFKTCYAIRVARGHTSEQVLEEVRKITRSPMTYHLGITIKQRTGAKFKRTNIVDVLKAWVKWRVQLEIKMISHTIANLNRKLFRLQTMLLAVDHLDIIFKALRQKDTKAYLMKHMKVTDEQAELILEMKVRQLKSLERTVLIASIKEVEKEISAEQRDLKNPNKRVDKQLSEFDVSIV